MQRVMIRIVLLITLVAFALGNLLNAQARPLIAVQAPSLSVEPQSVTFMAELLSRGVQTKTLQLENMQPTAPMTWTIQINTGGVLQPVVIPLGGVDDAELTVQIDTSPFALPGTYTGTITVTAIPSDTVNSPTTIDVELTLVDEFIRVYLPLVIKNFNGIAAFGVNFISSAEARADEVRYQRAAALNATINRWPFYWNRIEQDPLNQPGVFSWAWQDENTIADIDHGLTINAILLGTPAGLSTAGSPSVQLPEIGHTAKFMSQDVARDAAGRQSISALASPPQGLYLSVFNDGTDIPGTGKSINPDNRWAQFVYAAVNRYMPGGILAQQQGWTNGEGITFWEVWNEPDLDFFYSGTVNDYARLLKVAHLAAKHADPSARIIFGGLANFQKPTWLRDTLNVIATYPDRESNGWFFDTVATHNYSWAWQTYYNLSRARLTLDSFELTDKTLWLNETGVPVWDDPPGPINDPTSMFRATMQEQAAYTIQSATFAVWLEAEVILFFQLYDDFGNGCPGYDAFGLVRNVPEAGCNPGDGTPRAAYHAFQVVTQYLSNLEPYWRKRPTANQEIIALQNYETNKRVIAMWARDYFTETVLITSTASSAVLVYPDGITQTLIPIGGVYTITLPAATNTNTPTTDGKAPIGGAPRILIENDPAITP